MNDISATKFNHTHAKKKKGDILLTHCYVAAECYMYAEVMGKL